MRIKQQLLSILHKLPYIKGLYEDNRDLRKNACYPPGHYYSSINSVEDIQGRQDSIW